MRTRSAGLALAGLGATCQAAGIGVDAWLHSQDPTLAAREGVFSLDNGGHVLLIVGIGLVVVGVALALVGPWLYEPDRPRRPALRLVQWGAPVALVGMLAGGTAAASQSSLGEGHDHAPAATAGHSAEVGQEHSHPSPSRSPDATAPAPPDHGHGDGDTVPNRPLEPAVRARLASQLVQARKAALRYPTIRDAERAGYRRVVRYVPLISAHYMRFDLVDGTFDIDNPEMLLYDGDAPHSRIVGLSYYQRSAVEPEGFAGPNDHWHRHVGLCVSIKTFEVVGDEKTTMKECRARGGVKTHITDAWMVHAWVVPGWESPAGVFSAEHADLR